MEKVNYIKLISIFPTIFFPRWCKGSSTLQITKINTLMNRMTPKDYKDFSSLMSFIRPNLEHAGILMGVAHNERK